MVTSHVRGKPDKATTESAHAQKSGSRGSHRKGKSGSRRQILGLPKLGPNFGKVFSCLILPYYGSRLITTISHSPETSPCANTKIYREINQSRYTALPISISNREN